MSILEIKDLCVDFPTAYGLFRAVDHLSFSLNEGEILGFVGESGSGKSVSMMALMGLIPAPGKISAQHMRFGDVDLLKLRPSQRRKILGKDIAMIFQDPITSLNPCYTIGFQMIETLGVHQSDSKKQLFRKAVDLLSKVGIPDPEKRMNSYPHQLSGGMCQRVMIAMAIACQPKLLIADEPTTALDVTIQAQILELLKSLQHELSMSMILITHNMGVVAEMADHIAVMYAGQLVEHQGVQQLFEHPRHPYTEALLNALPERCVDKNFLPTIPGVVPGAYDRPTGCLFNPRCSYATEQCVLHMPNLEAMNDREGFADPSSATSAVRCFYPLPKPPSSREHD